MKVKKMLTGAVMALGVVVALVSLNACGSMANGEQADELVNTSPTENAQDDDTAENSGIDMDDGSDFTNSPDDVAITSASLEGVEVTCPDGWEVSATTASRITVTNTETDASLDITVQDDASDTGDTESNATALGDETYDVGGTTWYGTPESDGFEIHSDGQDGSRVNVVGRSVSIEEAMPMLEGIVLA